MNSNIYSHLTTPQIQIIYILTLHLDIYNPGIYDLSETENRCKKNINTSSDNHDDDINETLPPSDLL